MPLDFADFVDFTHIRMVNSRLCLRFLNKSLPVFFRLPAKKLQRNRALQSWIVGFVYQPHSAFAKDPGDFVAVPVVNRQIGRKRTLRPVRA